MVLTTLRLNEIRSVKEFVLQICISFHPFEHAFSTQGLIQNSSITALDLSQNSIGTKGAQEMARALSNKAQ